MRRFSIFAVFALGAAGLVGSAGADTTNVDPSRLTIAVAPFESQAPPGAAVPDVATLLADRIGTLGVRRIVGPAQLGVAAVAEPPDASVVEWAKAADVDSVIVGRATRIGNQLSIDVRIHSGKSGVTTRTYVAEVMRPEQLSATVEQLAGQVMEGAAEIRDTLDFLRDRRQGKTAKSARRGTLLDRLKDPSGGSAFGFGDWDRSKPLSITSEELEASDNDGARSLLFKRNVRVEQGDMSIRAATLRATYPPNQNEPDRLEANGGVYLKQGTRTAKCDSVLYNRLGEKLICSGHAVLSDGDNTLTGEKIEIDLRTSRVQVKGGASVVIQPGALEGYEKKEKGAEKSPEPKPGPTPEAAPGPTPEAAPEPTPEPAP